jgi:hypothetical protein
MTEEDMPKGAVATTKNLDLCVEMDEPEMLVEELQKLASRMAGRSSKAEAWVTISRAAADMARHFQAANQPAHRV